MDYLFAALLSTESPQLPAPWLAHLYLSLGWGLVLAAFAAAGLRRRNPWHPRGRAWLPLALLLLCLLPGSLSPAYWLGLAFRAPSGLFTLLCAWALWCHYRPQAPAVPLEGMWGIAWVLVAAGWALLLDTFAVLPVGLYAAGFAPLTLGVLVLLGLLPWLLRGATSLSVLLVGACVLHVALRLPSGNVWDALLDPWLWLLLQGAALRRALQRH